MTIETDEKQEYKIKLKKLSEQISSQEKKDHISYQEEKDFLFDLKKKINTDQKFRPFITFNKKEENCILTRKFVKSMPFNLDELDDTFFFTKIRDTYKSISYRTLGLQLLEQQTFFEEKVTQDILKKLEQVRNLKQELLALLDEEKEDYFLLKDNNEVILAKATEEQMKIAKEKSVKMTYLSDEYLKLKNNDDEIRLVSNTILKEDPFFEAKLQIFKKLDFVEILVSSSQTEESFSDIDQELFKSLDLEDFYTKLLNLGKPMKIKKNIEIVKLSLENERNLLKIKSKSDPQNSPSEKKLPSLSQLNSLISKTKSEINKLESEIKSTKNSLLSEIKKLKLELRNSLDTPRYKHYLEKLDNYKNHSETILEANIEIGNLNQKGEYFSLLVSALENNQNADVVIPFELRLDVEEEIENINKRKPALKEIKSISLENENLNSIITEIEGLEFENQGNVLKILNKKKNLILDIKKLEEYFDLKLAQLFWGVLFIPDKHGNTVSVCFSEIDLGKNLFLMVKSNIILNFEIFTQELLKNFTFAQTRSFILLNYAVFVSKDHLQRIEHDYKLTKTFPGEEEMLQKKMVNEFIQRFRFLSICIDRKFFQWILYTRKISSIASFYLSKMALC